MLFAIFISLFVFLLFVCSACVLLMSLATERPFFHFCLFSVYNSLPFSFHVFIGRANDAKLGTDRSVSPLTCADVRALQLSARRSSITTPSLDTPNYFLTVFLSVSNCLTGLRPIVLQPTPCFSCNALTFVNPGRSGFSLRAAMF